MWNPKAHSPRGGSSNGFADDRWRMAEDRGAPRSDVVDQLATIDIPDVRALRALHEKWLAAHSAESADGRIDAARNESAGF